MRKTTVLLADDHTIVRNGIRSLLEGFEEIDIVAEAGNGQEAIDMTREWLPDILLVDIAMPFYNGIQVTQAITRAGLPTRCVVLSMHDNEDYILRSVEAGAAGYLLKDTTREEMRTALRTVSQGEKYFGQSVSGIIVNAYLHKMQHPAAPKEKRTKPSKKEQVVLKYIVDGLSSREIAEKLNLSVRTVDNHRASMMRRLGVKNAVELARVALEQKLV